MSETDEYKKLVLDLAEWSSKYPRGVIYSMTQKSIDDELIKLEERAKELVKKLNHELEETGCPKPYQP